MAEMNDLQAALSASAMARNLILGSEGAPIPETLVEWPPVEAFGLVRRRRCASCDYFDVTDAGLAPAQSDHVCRRDDVMRLIVWPGGW